MLQLQKKIAEGESKLKQQQNLYEASGVRVRVRVRVSCG